MEKQLELEFKGDKLKGILIKEDKEYLTLKLTSGYNANLKKSEIKILKEEKIEPKTSINSNKSKVNSNLPKITILHTGGTIASKIDYETGAVSWKFTPEELLALYPELLDIANIDAKMIRNMASDDMRFEHYNVLLDEVEKAIKEGAQGVIISQGTDTLHYTAVALQYALEKLPVPVLIVGAQRSSDRAGSDASTNLKAAVEFIISNNSKSKRFNRVGICMHATCSDDTFNILDGINAKKAHSSRRDAFKQINYEPFAQISKEKGIAILREDLLTDKNSSLEINKYDPSLKIGLIKIHPHPFPEEFDILKFYDGVILEGTGLGHIPLSNLDEFTTTHPKILEKVKVFIDSGKKAVISTQTVHGEICMDVYSPGRVLKETGILGNRMNLITETLFMRLAYCLSKDKKNFQKIWDKNLEGFEIKTLDIEE